MREVLFRIKDGNNQWIFGYPVFYDDGSFEFSDEKLLNELKPFELCTIHTAYNNTLGQFTGIFDKHDNKVFEGDIIKECIGKTINGKPRYIYYCINWCDDDRCYRAFKNGLKGGAYTLDFARYILNKKEIEVVGNVWDNPELLGGAKCQSE